MTNFATSASDVLDAARRIKGAAVYTPLLKFAPLNERVGHRVLFRRRTAHRLLQVLWFLQPAVAHSR